MAFSFTIPPNERVVLDATQSTASFEVTTASGGLLIKRGKVGEKFESPSSDKEIKVTLSGGKITDGEFEAESVFNDFEGDIGDIFDGSYAKMFSETIINGTFPKKMTLQTTSTLLMFADVEYFTSDISEWDVSSVRNMGGMFMSSGSFTSDISKWDVSSVTNMRGMFLGAGDFTSDISDWDVSSVRDMNQMFMEAISFNSDLATWDVSSVTDMGGMFKNAVEFNSDISDWDVSRVTNMKEMFAGAESFDADLSGWNVSFGTDMTDMFIGASSFDFDNRPRSINNPNSPIQQPQLNMPTVLTPEELSFLNSEYTIIPETLKTCDDVIGGETDVNAVSYIKEDQDTNFAVYNTKNLICFSLDDLSHIINDHTSWIYECIGQSFSDGSRGIIVADNAEKFLKLPFGQGFHTVSIPKTNLDEMLAHLKKTKPTPSPETVQFYTIAVVPIKRDGKQLKLTHTVSVDVKDHGGSHVGGSHCQAGSEAVVWKFEKAVIGGVK